MLSRTIRPARTLIQTCRLGKRFNSGHGVHYGPEQNLLSSRNLIAGGIVAALGVAVWADRYWLTPLVPGKSAIGDRLIPDSTKKEQELQLQAMEAEAVKSRETLQMLFSAENTARKPEENVRNFPVPAADGARSLAPGRYLDADAVDERRPRSTYFK